MPKGPKGEKRPADVIGAAVMVGKIATGEVQDTGSAAPNRARGGKIGGKRRAEKLSSAERKEIAQKAAKIRWKNCSPTD
jgi:hypothetical protein